MDIKEREGLEIDLDEVLKDLFLSKLMNLSDPVDTMEWTDSLLFSFVYDFDDIYTAVKAVIKYSAEIQ
ncbi:MAG: hypothetical protein LUB61_00675 [Eggerthellaceae bacterium]|nr:hypothetical protein [Eggerthellaceae bacterium]